MLDDDDDDDKSVTNDNRLLANRPLPLNDSYLVKKRHRYIQYNDDKRVQTGIKVHVDSSSTPKLILL